jgi:ABC-type nitrate/sulfonate/bicarbonate transport system substrate-binding protein
MQNPVSLTVGGVPEHFNLPWHMGIESGAFSAAGLEVNYVDYPGGTGAMTQALRASELDVAVVLTEGCVADILNGNPSRIVKTYVQSPLVWGIHVAGDSALDRIEQIEGKRIAISRFGSGSHLMAIVDAAERGWSTDDMNFVVVRNLEGARTALAEGSADVFFWERFTTSPFVSNGEFRRLGVRETPWPAFVICVREDVLESETEAVSKMLAVINRQCRQLMSCSNAVETIAERYGLQRDQVEQWFGMTRWDTEGALPERGLQAAIAYLNRLKITKSDDAVAADVCWEQ